ncbi:universal stress protein, UspA [Thalassotalea litorea]|uniref:Universal stress protein, UspA n=1 Tax=Thalassotalea litorea TaxID=2020715 RepID=A0A5R9IB84_9GAMM|nr:universal stress protein [Thalassotalea litorea]TLU59491.1 universal stress protein, UspA [Thalassotalea litorea]
MWLPSKLLFIVSEENDNKNALIQALIMAKNAQASLTIATVLPSILNTDALVGCDFEDSELYQSMMQAHQTLVNSVSSYAENVTINHKLLLGMPFIEVIKEAIADNIDLVVKAADSEGLLNRVFGSEDMRLMRKCPVPVWLVQPRSHRDKSSAGKPVVLATVDASEDYPEQELATRQSLNFKVIEIAVSIALAEGAELHLLSVWTANYESSMRGPLIGTAKDKVDQYVDDLKHQHDESLNRMLEQTYAMLGDDVEQYIKPKVISLKGSPRKKIAEYAQQIDATLVVMGTVARTGVAGFIMGNTAENILLHLQQSVIAVKPQGFVSPVA